MILRNIYNSLIIIYQSLSELLFEVVESDNSYMSNFGLFTASRGLLFACSVCFYFGLLARFHVIPKVETLWTWSLRKSSMGIPDVRIGNNQSDAFDTGTQRHISIISSAFLPWGFSSLTENILLQNSRTSLLSNLKYFTISNNSEETVDDFILCA